jgi:Coenzyme PQQ synthesis protein D (PqqD)
LPAIAAEQRFIRSQSVVARVVARETLIVPIRGKVGDLASIYRFNATGTLVWKVLESPRTIAEMAAAIAKEYEIELADAEQDVGRFVSEMQSVGLVDVVAERGQIAVA